MKSWARHWRPAWIRHCLLLLLTLATVQSCDSEVRCTDIASTSSRLRRQVGDNSASRAQSAGSRQSLLAGGIVPEEPWPACRKIPHDASSLLSVTTLTSPAAKQPKIRRCSASAIYAKTHINGVVFCYSKSLFGIYLFINLPPQLDSGIMFSTKFVCWWPELWEYTLKPRVARNHNVWNEI